MSIKKYKPLWKHLKDNNKGKYKLSYEEIRKIMYFLFLLNLLIHSINYFIVYLLVSQQFIDIFFLFINSYSPSKFQIFNFPFAGIG